MVWGLDAGPDLNVPGTLNRVEDALDLPNTYIRGNIPYTLVFRMGIGEQQILPCQSRFNFQPESCRHAS